MRLKGKICTESAVQQFISMLHSCPLTVLYTKKLCQLVQSGACISFAELMFVRRSNANPCTLACIPFYAEVMHTVSKINREAVLRWAPERLYCILTARDIADGSVKVWAELNLVCG